MFIGLLVRVLGLDMLFLIVIGIFVDGFEGLWIGLLVLLGRDFFGLVMVDVRDRILFMVEVEVVGLGWGLLSELWSEVLLFVICVVLGVGVEVCVEFEVKVWIWLLRWGFLVGRVLLDVFYLVGL